MTNSTIHRKLTALRSLFSYLQTYGYIGANPAHGKFVKAPAVPRDGKTVALSPHESAACSRPRRCTTTTRRSSRPAYATGHDAVPISVVASVSWSASAAAITEPTASTGF